MAASHSGVARGVAHRDYIRKTWRKKTLTQQAQALGLSVHHVARLRSQLIKAGICKPCDGAGKFRRWSEQEITAIIARVRNGYDLGVIAQHFGVAHDAISAALRTRGHTFEGLRDGYVWTAHELAQIFGVHGDTMRAWIRSGWLTPTVMPKRRQRWHFTRATVHAMLSNRATWPAWSPAQISNLELRAYARFERIRANGRWVKVRDLAQRRGYSPHSVTSLVRHNTLGVETVQVSGTWFAWEPA